MIQDFLTALFYIAIISGVMVFIFIKLLRFRSICCENHSCRYLLCGKQCSYIKVQAATAKKLYTDSICRISRKILHIKRWLLPNTMPKSISVFFGSVYGFYPRDAMLAQVIEIATCLSVRPSRASIVSKRRMIAA